MRSRPEAHGSWPRRHATPAAFGLVAALALGAAQAASAQRPALEAAVVEAAASAVRADPDLGGMRKDRTWRFKDDSKKDTTKPPPSAPWLLDLARWLAEGGRVLVWLLGAAALAMVIVAGRRWLMVRGEARRALDARLPSHVGELDIRPESLPADLGAAVRTLWLAGERRAALSLLYRGALSRLVHSHAVAIGDSSTEGDCVRLARAALPAETGAFVTHLVHAWQLAVYGNRPLDTARVLGLCDDFDRMLPALAPAQALALARTGR